MKPNFTGSWILDPHRSSVQIPLPDAVKFTIEHVEPRFRLERTLVFGKESDKFSVNLFTDDRETAFEHRGARIRSRIHWEGAELKFSSVVLRGAEEGSNEVIYRLADGGDTLIAREQFRSASVQYQNTWVFTREKQV